MASDGFEFLNATTSVTTVNKFGRNTNVDSNTDTDIWDLTTQPIWLAPKSSLPHSIVSTDAETNGAATVQIYGLREWDGVESSEVVTLTGATPVNTVRSYVIIHRMKMITWGTLGPNIGTITATTVGQAGGETITAQINPGEGQTQMSVYGIGSRHYAWMTGYYASIQKAIAGAQASTVKLLINTIPQTITTGFVTKHIQNVGTVGSSYMKHDFNPYFRISGPAIIKMQGNGSGNDLDVSAGFDLILKEKDGSG